MEGLKEGKIKLFYDPLEGTGTQPGEDQRIQ
jgi:hypothetical protein